MGLDMYLYAEKYVSNYSHQTEGKEDFEAALKALDFPVSIHSPHILITGCVMYWRKANAIHSWFVENVQGGVDECQRSYVPKEKLRELIQACKDDDLTPVSGFFFGSTDKDDWYYEDLKQTVNELESILADPKSEDLSFYYQSSW